MGGKPRQTVLVLGPWYSIGIDGAEHFVAESGWMLARVQHDSSNRTFEWNVATTRGVIAWGVVEIVDRRRAAYYLDVAKAHCLAVVKRQHQHLVRLFGRAAGPEPSRK